jgi:hypothetical protein
MSVYRIVGMIYILEKGIWMVYIMNTERVFNAETFFRLGRLPSGMMTHAVRASLEVTMD